MTPFILLNNIIRYVGTLGLEAPALGAIRPVLTKAAVTKIQPYFGEIVKRLGASEPLEQVAQSIAPQAGVSTAQVMLYIAALAKAAAEHQKAVSS